MFSLSKFMTFPQKDKVGMKFTSVVMKKMVYSGLKEVKGIGNSNL